MSPNRIVSIEHLIQMARESRVIVKTIANTIEPFCMNRNLCENISYKRYKVLLDDYVCSTYEEEDDFFNLYYSTEVVPTDYVYKLKESK